MNPDAERPLPKETAPGFVPDGIRPGTVIRCPAITERLPRRTSGCHATPLRIEISPTTPARSPRDARAGNCDEPRGLRSSRLFFLDEKWGRERGTRTAAALALLLGREFTYPYSYSCSAERSRHLHVHLNRPTNAFHSSSRRWISTPSSALSSATVRARPPAAVFCSRFASGPRRAFSLAQAFLSVS